jgi:hypothetical protein
MPVQHRRKRKMDADPGSHELNILWVAEMFSDPEREARAKEIDAPTLQAWSLFQLYRVNEKTKREFMEKFYKPLYAKEKPAEKSGAMSDDQRKFFKLFELLEMERPDLADLPRNPVVSPESVVIGTAEASRDCSPASIIAGTCVVGEPAVATVGIAQAAYAISSTDAAAPQA